MPNAPESGPTWSATHMEESLPYRSRLHCVMDESRLLLIRRSIAPLSCSVQRYCRTAIAPNKQAIPKTITFQNRRELLAFCQSWILRQVLSRTAFSMSAWELAFRTPVPETLSYARKETSPLREKRALRIGIGRKIPRHLGMPGVSSGGIERIFDFGKTLAKKHEDYLKVSIVLRFCHLESQ